MAQTFASDVQTTSPAAAAHRSAFRADIEGLRALCVGAVVAFHAFPSVLPGGFIGVDVFFVISGYLITQLLLREIEATGRIDLADFWARRLRRILPAATLVLCATALMALFVSAVDPRLLGRHIIAAALFYYNWRQADAAVDYLAQDDRDNPLLHYWSLAVEEQFYLLWPLLLAGITFWLARRNSRSKTRTAIGILIGTLALTSFIVSIALTETSAAQAFFNTFARAWQLLAGAAVAHISMRANPPRAVVAGALGISALGVFIASCVLISEKVAYPGWAAAAPTLSAALLLYVGAARCAWSSAFLSIPPLRYVGRISFSWYLWHWPLIVFAAMVFADAGGDTESRSVGPAWVAIAISFVLAGLSYRYVEQPIRHNSALKASRRNTYFLGALLITAGAGTGLAMKAFGPDSVPLGNGKFMSRAAIKQDRPRIYSDRCLLRFTDVAYGPCVYGDKNGTKSVVLFGDSHAGNWFSALNLAAQEHGWRLIVRIKASCRPIDGPQTHGNGQDYPECLEWRQRVLSELEEIKPDLFVVSSMTNPLPAEREQIVFRKLAGIAPTVVMRDTPVLPETPGDCLKRTGAPAKCEWELAKVMAPQPYPRTDASNLPSGVSILDLNDRICPDGRCRAITKERALMSDKHHLSDSFSKTLADSFGPLLSGNAK